MASSAEARVVDGLGGADLTLPLWAVRTRNRAKVLEELLKGPLPARVIGRRTGIPEGSCFRSLNELMEAGFVVVKGKIRGPNEPRARIYMIDPEWEKHHV